MRRSLFVSSSKYITNEDSIGVDAKNYLSPHVRNVEEIVDHCGGNLIFTKFKGFKGGLKLYPDFTFDTDAIVFVHASHYQYWKFIDPEVLKGIEDYQGSFWYIINEYGMGDNPILRHFAKEYGIGINVVANFDQGAERGWSKYFVDAITSWHNVNLNALIYRRMPKKRGRFVTLKKQPLVYYGTFRPDRADYFRKYADRRLVVSTSLKNWAKWKENGVNARFIPPLKWHGNSGRLDAFFATLYIEDLHTHDHYNRLSNRFYEALSFDVACFFDESCRGTVEKSGYPLDDWFFVDSVGELHGRIEKAMKDKMGFSYPEEVHEMAACERIETLDYLRQIIVEE